MLAARIDRLERAEKELLQELSVIGREFPLGLLRQIVSQAQDELYRVLSSLQAKEFLYEQPALPEVQYLFKHALTQEVAYGTVLHDRRKALHERTAKALEELYNSSLQDHYNELAHHYQSSGNTHKAVEYLQLAGQQAAQRSANEEAIRQLTNGLELLKTLPQTPERDQQELNCLLTLGPVFMATQGYAAPEIEEAYTRARELCQQAGNPAQLFLVLRGFGSLYAARAQYRLGYEIGEQLLHLAQQNQDPSFFIHAYGMLAIHSYQLGNFLCARKYFEQSIALYHLQPRKEILRYGEDPGVASLGWGAWVLWVLGYPEQALKQMYTAIALAQELSHPFSLVHVLAPSAFLYNSRREPLKAQERAEVLIALCSQHGFPYRLAIGKALQGEALAEQGQIEEGIAQIHQALVRLRDIGAEVARPHWLGHLARAYVKKGQPQEGLALVDEALEIVSKTEERFAEAELYRIKGEVVLQSRVQSTKGEAEACFHKALDTARQQSAKSWELRAAMSLARLWQQQGKKQTQPSFLRLGLEGRSAYSYRPVQGRAAIALSPGAEQSYLPGEKLDRASPKKLYVVLLIPAQKYLWSRTGWQEL